MSSELAQPMDESMSHKRYFIYIPLPSEPQVGARSGNAPAFTYCNRYLTKRRVLRNMRRMRREQLDA